MLGEIDFKKIEEKWQKHWEKEKVYAFNERSAKPVYSIDSPPPFTSGALHMGHMLSYSYFDFAARYKRMKGCNVFFPQGWDCQGFPTEVKVEEKYGKNIGRDEFLKKCVEFTENNIAKMREQMNEMGFSPDWKLEYKTMSEDYHRRVQYSLLKMYENGLVYREKHPVLFCVHCESAIAKAEAEDQERETTINFIKFKLQETGEDLLIATTRPEYLHACVAVFVNPNDEKNKKLVGKHAVVPLFHKIVPIKEDRDVDPEFGTGVVMVCTFGDKTDVVWAYRHALPIVDSVSENGLLKNAGKYSGLSLKKAREEIVSDLEKQGLAERKEKLMQVVKLHDRCDTPIEFIPSMQWFIRVKEFREDIVGAAKKMEWIPPFSLQYLIDWATGLEFDWCISRQRIYGTPIPFWHCEKCGKVLAPKESELPVDPAKHEPKENCACGGTFAGETSVCDVWVDSSITPLIIGQWPENKELFEKVYPASLRPQGLEIIRTWAFYTIFRCLKLTGKPCFKELLINGNVLGTDGKKMSKSAGNYEDPDVLLKKYAADALRQWAALSGAFAKDRPFSYKDVERGQAFLIKLWNASKLVEKALQGFDYEKTEKEINSGNLGLRVVDKWILSKLNKLVAQCDEAMDGYDYFATINAIHEFFWGDFCDYYLEEIKYRIYKEKEKKSAQFALHKVLETVLRLAAPIVVFVSEEIYHEVFGKRGSLHLQDYPACEKEFIKEKEENIGNTLCSILSQVRKYKAARAMPLSKGVSSVSIEASEEIVQELASIEEEIIEVGRAARVLTKISESQEIRVEVSE